MFAGVVTVCFSLATCALIADQPSGKIFVNSDVAARLWEKLEGHASRGRLETSTNAQQSEMNPVGEVVAPFLTPVYIIVTQGLYVGSLVNNRAVLTSCSTTLVPISPVSYLLLKAEHVLVALYLPVNGKPEPVMTGVMEIRRHPTCDQPHPGGSWKNDVALLLLPVMIHPSPNILEPIKLPSMDFFEIYSAIKDKVGNNSTCQAVVMKFDGNGFPRSRSMFAVKIRKSSGCRRTCDYMIDHCTRGFGGYSIHIVDVNKFNKRDASRGAVIVCNDRIYGVLMPDFECGNDTIGHLPKPEAMLYMYVNFADPDLKTKPIIGSNGGERNRGNPTVYSIMLSQLIALATAYILGDAWFHEHVNIKEC